MLVRRCHLRVAWRLSSLLLLYLLLLLNIYCLYCVCWTLLDLTWPCYRLPVCVLARCPLHLRVCARASVDEKSRRYKRESIKCEIDKLECTIGNGKTASSMFDGRQRSHVKHTTQTQTIALGIGFLPVLGVIYFEKQKKKMLKINAYACIFLNLFYVY